MCCVFFFSSRRRHTRWTGDWSSDVCSSDLAVQQARNIVVVQRSQQLALGLESPQEFRAGEIAGHDLERSGLIELAVGPLGQVDRAHAAAAQQADGAIRA